MKPVWKILGLGVLIVLLADTMLTTHALKKIDRGLDQSLDSTSRMIQIQEAIVQKNAALDDVIQTTQVMDTQLSATLTATQNVQTHIDTIVQLNDQTLKINQSLAGLGGDGQKTLEGISTDMGKLHTSAGELYTALTKLQATVKRDSTNMAAMRGYADQMNAKVPGVLK
ncbi:hypothetical protein JJB07_01370 [Tumebacillus sp. ITR2]|uniref:DUF948 domain-containing protein n=1 Tax=Tumebacillus amylolyticus TaxID=2801339 RepID=A0ABS1J4W6_9BACL|nr:hypothetical protein [Tumebacillus amylolyticus]MBL0385282.1 hypothetical protein [Tumebacillus amylolyticus]